MGGEPIPQMLGELHGRGLALQGLALLVREEFPPDHSLAEIAATWRPAGMTQEMIDAIETLEREGVFIRAE